MWLEDVVLSGADGLHSQGAALFGKKVSGGTGALSVILAENGCRIILLEKDRRLASFLEQRFSGAGEAGNVTVVSGDALEFDRRELFPEAPVKLIGNLPYSVANPIIRHFLTPPSPINRAVLMLQDEVCQRFCASPRTKSYGVLTLRIQAYWEPRIVKTIGPEAFYPRPQVSSTVMVLEPRAAAKLLMPTTSAVRVNVFCCGSICSGVTS